MNCIKISYFLPLCTFVPYIFHKTSSFHNICQVLKLYAWEKIFARKTGDTRQQELEIIQKQSYARLVMMVIGGSSLFLVSIFNLINQFPANLIFSFRKVVLFLNKTKQNFRGLLKKILKRAAF